MELVIKIKPGLFKRKLGVRFDMLAFFCMMEDFDIGLGEEIGKISTIPYDEMICVAVYTGMKSYNFRHGKKDRYSKKKILGWIDDGVINRNHMKQLGALWNDFMRSFDNDKKKVTENR